MAVDLKRKADPDRAHGGHALGVPANHFGKHRRGRAVDIWEDPGGGR
jgi:hypothetical protein